MLIYFIKPSLRSIHFNIVRKWTIESEENMRNIQGAYIFRPQICNISIDLKELLKPFTFYFQ